MLSLKKKKKMVIRIKHMQESWGVTCAFDTDVIVSSKDQGEGQKAHSDMCATSVTLTNTTRSDVPPIRPP